MNSYEMKSNRHRLTRAAVLVTGLVLTIGVAWFRWKPTQIPLGEQLTSHVALVKPDVDSFSCPLTPGEVIQLHVQQDDSLVNICDVGSIHNRCARSAWAGTPSPDITGASQFKVHAAADEYANTPCAFQFESVSQAGWYLGYIHVYSGVYQEGCPGAKFDFRVIQGASGTGISLMFYGNGIGHGDTLIGFVHDQWQRGYLQKCRDANKWIMWSLSKASILSNDRKRYSFNIVRESSPTTNPSSSPSKSPSKNPSRPPTKSPRINCVRPKKCTFPFVYAGQTYHECTTKNHDQPWCSFDATYVGGWMNCNGIPSDQCSGSSSIATPIPNPICSPKKLCRFPFTYQGISYSECTRANHNQLWCSIDSSYSGRWVNCEAKWCNECKIPMTMLETDAMLE